MSEELKCIYSIEEEYTTNPKKELFAVEGSGIIMMDTRGKVTELGIKIRKAGEQREAQMTEPELIKIASIQAEVYSFMINVMYGKELANGPVSKQFQNFTNAKNRQTLVKGKTIRLVKANLGTIERT